MSLSSNTTQMRELSELRNHLKWLDEERRKSSRKMAELEQRLAQQGRDLADRDQKIQELESHVANFNQRFERMPEKATDTIDAEQRLHDLEWHISNMSAQLTRLPSPEDEEKRRQEERALLQEEIARAINATHERVETSQSMLEGQLRSEIVALRESDERRALVLQLGEQAAEINTLQETVSELSARLYETTNSVAADSSNRFSSLQEAVAEVSARLRETTTSLAAESQANTNTLAANIQKHLDTTKLENQARMDAIAVELQKKMEGISDRNVDYLPEIRRVEEQLSEVSQQQHTWDARMTQLVLTWDARVTNLEKTWAEQLPSLEKKWEGRLTQLEQVWGDQLLPLEKKWEGRLTQLEQVWGDQLSPLEMRWEERWTQLEQAWEEQLIPLEKKWEERLVQVEQTRGEQLIPLEKKWEGHLTQLEQQIEKLGYVGEIMPLLDRLEQELELRQAEELRLSTLIGAQDDRFTPLAATLEELSTSNTSLIGRLADSERSLEEIQATVKDINDNLKPAMIEANRRIGPLADRITALSNSAMKVEAGLEAISGDQIELREMIVNSVDDLQRNQSEFARQLEGWQATMDENKDTIERFTQQWITLSNQYKEARMAVQNFAHWQKQLEQQKREATEMLRIESNRMQSRWDSFMLEIQEKLKNFEIELNQKWQAFELDNEQKWSGSRRSEKLWREEIAAVDELIQKLQQDNRNLIWRVQTAQADAIKKWPRILMEEVEKAVQINPNRRLTSIAAPPSGEMSVVDAIEQGLITIDYNDDTGADI